MNPHISSSESAGQRCTAWPKFDRLLAFILTLACAMSASAQNVVPSFDLAGPRTTNVWAWGENASGQLGNNSTTASSVPVAVLRSGVLAGKTVIAVAAGNDHSVALCSDGTLAAWGFGSNGELGNNSTVNSSVPVLVDRSGVLSGKTVVAVAVANNHSLVLCSDGTLAAWGFNVDGRLGNNGTVSSSVPVLVDQSGVLSGKAVTKIAAGAGHTLVLCSDGTLAAWGYNPNGQVGNNSMTTTQVPVLVNQSGVLAGKTVIAIAAGDSHSLVICSDGTLAAWGRNDAGQLGNNSTTDSAMPVLVNRSGVLAGKTVTAMAGGGLHTVAVCSDGTLAAWGNNPSGQLGNNSTANSSVPVLVSEAGVLAGRVPVAVGGGNDHSLALCSDGTLVAWGANTHGELGNNSTTASSVPVLVSAGGLAAGERFTGLGTGLGFHSVALVQSPLVITVTVNEDSGAYLQASFATNISADPTADFELALNFIVSNDRNALFSSQPAVAANGTLTFTPANNANGSATVTMAVQDDGGIADGRVDTSASRTFTITVTSVNDAPTDIALSASSLAENNAANATVGTLSATDPDAGATHTFTLVTGAGSTDNAAFNLSGNSLRLNGSANFEVKSSYSVRVRATDQSSLTFEKVLTVTITDVNEAPTDIALSASSLAENNAANATVGTLSATDPDAGATHTFTLVTGSGSTDNAAFNLSGNSLRLNGSADFETKSSYSVRVRATDNGSLTFEKAFTVSITDVNEAPVVSVPANDPFAGRLLFTGFTNQVTGSSVGATAEFSEPLHAGSTTPGATVWLTWTAPASGEVNMDTRGSTFDTLLAVYTGDLLSTLALVAGNDDDEGQTTSRLSFQASAGTTYQIALSGYQGASGNVVFNLSLAAQPVITGQPASQVVQANASLNATFNVVAVGAPPLAYDWQKGGVSLPGATTASLTIVNVVGADAGDYRVIITNSFGSVTSVVATLTPATATANDAFANRITLTGENVTTGGENLTATLEAGEPVHAGVTSGASVWWTWTASRNGLLTVDTIGSSQYGNQMMNTVLAVYTGSSLGALTGVAANDDENAQPGLTTSRTVFRAVAGTTYQIAVASYIAPPPAGAQRGNIVLHLLQAPDNDLFANRLPFPPSTTQVRDNNIGAAKEAGERNHASLTGGKSVWWSWVAPASGRYQVDTTGSSFDTLLAVYTGNNLSALTLVQENDGDPIDNFRISRLQIQATIGTEYIIAVDGNSGETGDIFLNINPVPSQAVNDAFANRAGLSGFSARGVASTTGASLETGEPMHASLAGGKSVWWSWKAPASGLCQMDTVGSSFDTLLAVYTGTALNALTLIGENDGEPNDNFKISRLQFQAVAGTTYQIAVDGYLGEAGDAVLNLLLQPAPTGGGNDLFVNRYLLTGQTSSATGANATATKELAEPNHNGNRGGKSVWWRWVAPASALVTIDTRGSGFDTILGVYTGPSVGALTLIASDDQGADDGSTVTFNAVAGTEYQIAVDGYRDGAAQAQGNVVLNLRQYPPGPQIANDNFEDATPITALSPVVIGANIGAARQTGEPAHSGFQEGRSAWWTYTALADGPVTILTDGSELDTVLSVYVGSALSSLTLVAENDDPQIGEFHARVTFQATLGTVYRIAVDGYRNAMGLVKLTVISGITSPAAPSIKQQPASQTRFTGGAGGGTAVEFRVVATGALPLAFEWQRNSVIIDGATGPVLALTGVSAVNEGEYRVVVRNSFGMVSTLPATFTLLPGTFNDHFANRISLAGSSSTVSGSVLGATKEPDEPAHGGNDGGRSVWWKWTAPANGLVEIDTFGSSFDTTLAIYTGSALSGLSLVAENDDVPNGKVGISRVLFSATVGTEYQIAVDGFKTNSTTGNVVLNLRQPPAPPTPLQILTQPVSQTVIVGANVSLSVSASGKGVLSYQWRKDSADLLNATDATLTLNPVQLAQGGSYTVRVSDAFTDLLSQPALLVVATSRIAPPTPQNATAIQAQGFTLNLQLEVGRAFRVQASDTLIGGWTDIRSFVSDGSALEFLDVAAKTKSQRFYRVVSP